MGDLTDLQASEVVKIAGATGSGAETNFANVNSRNELLSVAPGDQSAANSTTTPLGSNATFTGVFEDVSDYAAITISVFADKVSGVDGYQMQWSPDGVNADVTSGSDVAANTGRGNSVTPRARFFRIVYVNGAVAQTVFRLQTTYHKTGSGLISRPISDTLDDENYAQTVRAVTSAQLPSGNYQSAHMGQATMANSVAVVLPSDQAAIPVYSGSPPGSEQIRQGEVTASAVSDIRKTTYTQQTTNAQRSFVSTSASDTNTGGTGVHTVLLTYYDATVAGPFTETITMNGTTPVNTVNTNICYVESIKVVIDGSFGGAVGTISMKAAAAGAGATIATIAVGDFRAIWAHHYVATGVTCNLTAVHISAGQASGAKFVVSFRRSSVPAAVDDERDLVFDSMRIANSDSYTRRYTNPLQFVGPGLLVAQVTPDTNSTTWYATLDFYE